MMTKEQVFKNEHEIVNRYNRIAEIVNDNTIDVFEKIGMIQTNMEIIETCFKNNEIYLKDFGV